jgi:hypothetical protein
VARPAVALAARGWTWLVPVVKQRPAQAAPKASPAR